MRLYNKKMTYWVIGLLLIAGCKKMVSVGEPINTLTTGEVFSSDAQAASSLAGIYSYMIAGGYTGFSGAMPVYGGLSSDELTSRNGVANSADYQFESSQMLSSNLLPNAYYWQPFYKEIYNANAILNGVASSAAGALSDSAKNELNGEAKFVRAFCYFYLTNLFGAVPMPLAIDFNQIALLHRSDPSAVYTQIVQDLKDAQSLLPSGFGAAAGERVRPNKFAATALLARVYLYQGDWADAQAEASAVIASSQYSLNPVANVFLKNSTESIWQLKPSTVTYPYGAYDANYFKAPFMWGIQVPLSQASAFLDPTIFNSYLIELLPTYYFSTSMSHAFEPGDLRKSSWTWYTPTPNAAPWTGDTLLWPYKYTTPVTTNVTQYYTVLRLAEQYLIRAEAEAEQNDLSDATADINTIRTRAGLSNTTATSQTDLLAAVAQERRVELFAEWGHRWLDLKRTGKATATLDTLSYKQPWNDAQLLYPIPLNELVTDPNLTQNHGY